MDTQESDHSFKIIISVVLFIEVLFFSQLPYITPKVATSKSIMTVFNGFSTGLFMGIAFLHMIPQANEKLGGDHEHVVPEGSHSHGDFPLGSLISLLTFLLVFAIEMSLHGDHDHCGERKHYHMENVLA